MLWLPDALRDHGINVRTLDGWDTVNYADWRGGVPEGAMWHHTATNAYTPNRTKANMYAGLSVPGSDRLYATGGGEATITIANAYPAPISSGYGVESLLTDFVRHDIRFVGRQTRPDDSPRWAGNRSYWNTEVILDGVGTWIDEDVWESITVAAAIISEELGWSAWRHVGHAQHTGRKIDLRDGRYVDMATTMINFQNDVAQLLEDDMFTHFKIGEERPGWEPVVWLLFMMEGGTVDPNGHSSQVEAELLWKANVPAGVASVRYVQAEDMDLIATYTGMNTARRNQIDVDGLYRYGLEIASLYEQAYRKDLSP